MTTTAWNCREDINERYKYISTIYFSCTSVLLNVIDFGWRFISHDIMRETRVHHYSRLRFLITRQLTQVLNHDSRDRDMDSVCRREDVMTNSPQRYACFSGQRNKKESAVDFCSRVFLCFICFERMMMTMMMGWRLCCLKRHHHSLLFSLEDANSIDPLAQGEALSLLALSAMDVIWFKKTFVSDNDVSALWRLPFLYLFCHFFYARESIQSSLDVNSRETFYPFSW